MVSLLRLRENATYALNGAMACQRKTDVNDSMFDRLSLHRNSGCLAVDSNDGEGSS